MDQEKKYLKLLVTACECVLKELDRTMKTPTDSRRGQRIAQISNYLEMHKDQAKHFGLGLPLK